MYHYQGNSGSMIKLRYEQLEVLGGCSDVIMVSVRMVNIK